MINGPDPRKLLIGPLLPASTARLKLRSQNTQVDFAYARHET
jgi:hypothetical protein